MVRYAQCCQPVPGDSVVGLRDAGAGHLDPPRPTAPTCSRSPPTSAGWTSTGRRPRARRSRCASRVTGEDRRGLYADIMEAISQTGTNIRGADLHTKDGSVFGTIFVEVDNLPHLGKVMKAVRRVKGVTEIERRESPPADTAVHGHWTGFLRRFPPALATQPHLRPPDPPPVPDGPPSPSGSRLLRGAGHRPLDPEPAAPPRG